jgi:restriction system protein
MAENSLFAILMRKPWWVSMAVAAVVAVLARLLLPEKYAVAGMLGSLPFVVIAGMAVWRQRGLPSAAQSEQWLQRLQMMSLRDFSAAVEAAYRHQGYEVQPIKSPGADLALRKYNQITLLGLRRWKAATTGVEPLRELHSAMKKHEADAGILLAGGEVGDKARSFASNADIQLVDAAQLVRMLHATQALKAPRPQRPAP